MQAPHTGTMSSRRLAVIAATTVWCLIITGWRPGSREYVPRTAPPACSCIGVPIEQRSVDLLLQRRMFLPELPTKIEPGCHAAVRSLAPSAMAAEFAALLHANSRGAPHSCTQDFQPVWFGRERTLGPLIHSLVPLLWFVALRAYVNTTGPGLPITGQLLPARLLPLKLRALADGRQCTSQSMECFIKGISRPISRGCGTVPVRALARAADSGHDLASSRPRTMNSSVVLRGTRVSTRAPRAGGASSSSLVPGEAGPDGLLDSSLDALDSGKGSHGQTSAIALHLRRDTTTPAAFEYALRQGKALDAFLPSPLAANGLFWTVSHTLRYLLVPSAAVQRRLDRERAAIGLSGAADSTSDIHPSSRPFSAWSAPTRPSGYPSGSTFSTDMTATSSSPSRVSSALSSLASLLSPSLFVTPTLPIAKSPPRPILAVHIRRAEPCAAYTALGRKRTCDPLSAYVPHVREMTRLYGYRSVLLVTDSAAVLANASVAFAPLQVLVRTDAAAAARRSVAAAHRDAKAVAAARRRRRQQQQQQQQQQHGQQQQQPQQQGQQQQQPQQQQPQQQQQQQQQQQHRLHDQQLQEQQLSPRADTTLPSSSPPAVSSLTTVAATFSSPPAAAARVSSTAAAASSEHEGHALGHELATDFLLDAFLLSEADGFVGKFSSNLVSDSSLARARTIARSSRQAHTPSLGHVSYAHPRTFARPPCYIYMHQVAYAYTRCTCTR